MSETLQREVTRQPLARIARRAAYALLICAYAVLWVGGVAQNFFGGAKQGEGRAASLFLLLAGMIVLWSTRVYRERGLLLLVAALGFIVEMVGVHLSFPFGAYIYTEALWPKVLGVPVVMALAWMTLVAYVKQLLLPFNLPAWSETIIAALCMTAFDLLIDPLAANQLGYWRWATAGNYQDIPLTNFAGWFITSLLIFSILPKRFTLNPAALLTGLSIILFFTLLAAAHGMVLVTLIGCLLCSAHLLRSQYL